MKTGENRDARRLALWVLREALDRGARLDVALGAGLEGAAALSDRDRAFAHNLAAGTIRHLGGLDFILSRLLDRPLSSRSTTIQHVLRFGLYQLLFLKVPDHAAVDTSVRLLQGHASSAFRGLVNAVLRRAARERSDLLSALERNPEAFLPDWLAERWRRQFGTDELRKIISVQLREPPLDLTLKCPQKTETEAAALEARVLAPGRLRLDKPVQPQLLPGFAEGNWWVQDVAASLPVTLFGELNGVEALDLCAAPGGKTLQLAAAGARVTAVDRSAERLVRLNENLARTGLTARVIESDILKYTPDRQYSCVLLDAPCSATGTLRRHPDVMWRQGPAEIATLVDLQRRMLDKAFAMVAPGGSLVYCVCSLENEEGDGQIAAFLDCHADAQAVFPPADWFPELPKHATPNGALTRPDGLADQGGMDGFFMARIDRTN